MLAGRSVAGVRVSRFLHLSDQSSLCCLTHLSLKKYIPPRLIFKWSGLKINYLKSSLSFLGEVSHNSFLVSSVFNYLVEQLPIYLTWDSPLKWGSSRELSGDLSLIRYKKDWRVGRDIFSLSEGELLC